MTEDGEILPSPFLVGSREEYLQEITEVGLKKLPIARPPAIRKKVSFFLWVIRIEIRLKANLGLVEELSGCALTAFGWLGLSAVGGVYEDTDTLVNHLFLQGKIVVVLIIGKEVFHPSFGGLHGETSLSACCFQATAALTDMQGVRQRILQFQGKDQLIFLKIRGSRCEKALLQGTVSGDSIEGKQAADILLIVFQQKLQENLRALLQIRTVSGDKLLALVMILAGDPQLRFYLLQL